MPDPSIRETPPDDSASRAPKQAHNVARGRRLAEVTRLLSGPALLQSQQTCGVPAYIAVEAWSQNNAVRLGVQIIDARAILLSMDAAEVRSLMDDPADKEDLFAGLVTDEDGRLHTGPRSVVAIDRQAALGFLNQVLSSAGLRDKNDLDELTDQDMETLRSLDTEALRAVRHEDHTRRIALARHTIAVTMAEAATLSGDDLSAEVLAPWLSVLV